MKLTRKIRDRMKRRDLMFFYRGIVTSVNSISLLMLLEKEMEGSEFGFVGKKRLFMFVLESLQNISRHAGKHSYADMSLVAYSKSATGYTVTTGNVMESSQVPDLRKRLKQINALDPDDVRRVYRKMLDESEISDKGGAGLGLIEIAKKTGNKLDFDFIKLDSKYHYYILSKTVDETGKGKNAKPEGKRFSGLPLIRMERMLSENNIYMVWSNHITPDVGKEMLSFTETKLKEDEVHAGIKRRVFSILVEVLENVAKYSPGKRAEKKYGMPVAIIKMDGNDFIISTGNLIANKKIGALKNKLDLVNSYDRAGLKELYRLKLSQQDSESDSTGSMGLIDIARKSGNPLVYSFEEIDEEYSYYIIEVRVDDQTATL
jgi:hypothetical protein